MVLQVINQSFINQSIIKQFSQPATLEIAVAKRRPAADEGQDFGAILATTGRNQGRHVLAAVRFGSAAHACGKLEAGDEIVQVGSHMLIYC